MAETPDTAARRYRKKPVEVEALVAAGEPLRVRTPQHPPDHRWSVLHFQTPIMGIVRFPHESVAVIRGD